MNTKTKYAMEHWRPTVTMNDDPNRPMTKYLFDGLTPISQYEAEITAHNHVGSSGVTRFVFSTSEGS